MPAANWLVKVVVGKRNTCGFTSFQIKHLIYPIRCRGACLIFNVFDAVFIWERLGKSFAKQEGVQNSKVSRFCWDRKFIVWMMWIAKFGQVFLPYNLWINAASFWLDLVLLAILLPFMAFNRGRHLIKRTWYFQKGPLEQSWVSYNLRTEKRYHDIGKIQLVVYYQCCVLIAWATTRL